MADEETSDWETNLKTEYADFFCNFFSDLEGKPVKFCGMGLNMVKCVKRSWEY